MTEPCPDCKGTGKYYPLTGPTEPCRLCGGPPQVPLAAVASGAASVQAASVLKQPITMTFDAVYDPSLCRLIEEAQVDWHVEGDVWTATVHYEGHT